MRGLREASRAPAPGQLAGAHGLVILMDAAGDSHLEDFATVVPDREDGQVWFRRAQDGGKYDPNAKHRLSMNKQWREAKGK